VGPGSVRGWSQAQRGGGARLSEVGGARHILLQPLIHKSGDLPAECGKSQAARPLLREQREPILPISINLQNPSFFAKLLQRCIEQM